MKNMRWWQGLGWSREVRIDHCKRLSLEKRVLQVQQQWLQIQSERFALQHECYVYSRSLAYE